ncbi:glycosyltransferase N-terminal domain-containing protein [Ichthyenterobacterium sp. W332]|uniref:3-deoxy-D-manno-octulosonic acid transferase n=1 Tax=Microcosmobacter mediterraneus TaxID=3075607 RepID=A0ABU2YK73_9FLAO|nr:glycosyltransferase N-terminal domain-containing protein [Ichthyenterobacterium sp. W332]MDT0558564.1 glycosyltransferase N-terminal domain-containing protein [Ichthyenterobacterium sp. W332]
MRILYNILTHIAIFHVKLVSLFNNKLKLGVDGRNQTFTKLKNCIATNDKTLWFHCSSLGEYEQGLPVFEQLKADYPHLKIVLSFFSPSGYEIRKDTEIADVVVYLPFDTINNSKKIIKTINPQLVVFVKYEIWPNYLYQLHTHNIPTLLISALFKERHSYFKWYGRFMRQSLFYFTHIFTQDKTSKKLLETIHYPNVTVSGDTRFDRVTNQISINNSLNFMTEFKNDKCCIVAGSTWKEDEDILVPFINTIKNDSIKFIIAPHNIKLKDIQHLKERITKSVVLYSEHQNRDISDFDVLILDTIGLLSKTYNYADIAYIGGAMGSTGLHNTLEAAVFGVPIIIGKDYDEFPEAKAMISKKGMFSVNNREELFSILKQLIQNVEYRNKAGNKNSSYIKNNRGAVIQIMDYIRKYIKIKD